MKIFELENPISQAIEKKFIELINPNHIDANKKIVFLDYSPAEGEIFAYPGFKNVKGYTTDGIIAVYASRLNGEGSSSQTGSQDTLNSLTIDCYGFGDVFKDGEIESKSVISSTNRAKLLATIAYKAVMDQTQLVDAFGENITIAGKQFISTENMGSVGTGTVNRTISFYRSEYQLKLGEDIPSEPLGSAFAGSSSILETENPVQ